MVWMRHEFKGVLLLITERKLPTPSPHRGLLVLGVSNEVNHIGFP